MTPISEHAKQMRLVLAAPDMAELLVECYELLDDYSDVNDGEDGQPRPNKAMSMMTAIECLLHKAGVQL